MSEPTYHHYISKFYLDKFASNPGNGKPKTNIFDKNTKQIRRKLTRKVGGSDHFNRFFSENDPNAVEKFYAREIETPAGAALKRILEKKAITSRKDLHDVLLFFAMTTVRNPKARNTIEDPMKFIDAILIRSALGDEGRGVLEKRLKRSLIPQEHVSMEFPLIHPIFKILVEKEWTILEVSAEAGDFITCDDPLQIISANEPRPWGFESNGAILYAPLCPTLALLGQDCTPNTTKSTLSLEKVARLNSLTMSSAYRLVFFKSDNFYVLRETDASILRWTDLTAKHIAPNARKDCP